jgi:hypothetical protein
LLFPYANPALIKLKIPYVPQKRISIPLCEKVNGLKRITITDFFIAPNICLYVDGDYWHSLPNVVKKDNMVNENLPKMGYKIIRITESEIKKGEKCYYPIIEKIKSLTTT